MPRPTRCDKGDECCPREDYTHKITNEVLDYAIFEKVVMAYNIGLTVYQIGYGVGMKKGGKAFCTSVDR